MENNICQVCHSPLQLTWFYCPNCGKNLKEKPIEISLIKQIFIYLVSFFLAPLGLGWGFKYIKSNDEKVRMVGIISILLTVISIVIMIFVFKGVFDQYAKLLNSINSPGSSSLNNINIDNMNIDNINKLLNK